MRIKMILLYGRYEASKNINLPEGLSPHKGMIIHTSCDRDFLVANVDVSIDKPNDLNDPSVILILFDRDLGELNNIDNGEELFREICGDLEECGWDVPQF